MIRSKYKCALLAVGLGFLTCMILLAISGERQAEKVSRGVLRFHIVANSNSSEDQALKMKVRDGIATLSDQLFAGAQSKAQAIEIAKENRTLIEDTARDILKENGDDSDVEVKINHIFFPTKQYQNVSFPAGYYDAINVNIGAAKGRNFWCVMFPSLCVPSVSESNEALLGEVLEEDQVEFVTHPYTLKFKFAEWWGNLVGYFKNDR